MTRETDRRTLLKAIGAGAGVTLVAPAASAEPTGRTAEEAASDRGPGGSALRTDRFTVAVDGVEVPGWRSVTVPGSTTQQGEYREGDEPDREKKTWGQTTFGNLEMERGVRPDDTRILDWRDAIREGRRDDGRKEVTVDLLDRRGDPQVRWTFSGAWIREYGPWELDASADGDVATESVTIAFDRMKRTRP